MKTSGLRKSGLSMQPSWPCQEVGAGLGLDSCSLPLGGQLPTKSSPHRMKLKELPPQAPSSDERPWKLWRHHLEPQR